MSLRMHFLVLIFTFILLLFFSAVGEGRYLLEDQPSKSYGSVKLTKPWVPHPGKHHRCKSPPPPPPPPPPSPRPPPPPPPEYKACCQNSCCARNGVSFCCGRQ